MSTNVWQGERVRLRAIESEDWEFFANWDQDSETARHCYFVPPPKSKRAAREWAEKEALKLPENDELNLVIETLSGATVGSINSHSANRRNGTFSYGVAIHPAQRGKGYASDAIRILLRHFFLELRYQKCNAHIYSFNHASIELHKRLGFQQEGCLRRQVFTNGHYHDELIFGITCEEYLKE